jgi:hypothetical protein
MGSSDVLPEVVVPEGTAGGPAVAGLLVGGRRDRQSVLGEHPADRRDAEHLFVIVDEFHDHAYRRSSSAAKKTDADFRISFARFSSFTSARNRRTSAA